MGRRGRGGKPGGKGDFPPGGKGDYLAYAGQSGAYTGPPGAKGFDAGSAMAGPPGYFAGPPGNFAPAEMPAPARGGGRQAQAGRGSQPQPSNLGGSSAARRSPPTLQLGDPDLPPPRAEAELAPHLWPITPLGLPRTPPPLPPVPSGIANSAFFPVLAEESDTYSGYVGEASAAPGALAAAALSSSAKPANDASVTQSQKAPPLSLPAASASSAAEWREPAADDWTPVADRQAKKDRRTFFHTEGKPLTFDRNDLHRQQASASERCELGQVVDLPVEDVHFGNPRIGVMKGEPAPMPQMLKWAMDKFAEHTLECAQIDFGEYRAWCAVGIRSNRLLYAMKRSSVGSLKATVVAPPPPEDDDADLTYGASVQGIQLVP